MTISVKPQTGFFNPFISGFTSGKSQPLIGNHLAKVVKNNCCAVAFKVSYLEDTGQCQVMVVPNKMGIIGQKHLRNYLVLGDGVARTRGRMWGASCLLWNALCPNQTPHRHVRSSHGDFRRDKHLDTSTDELCLTPPARWTSQALGCQDVHAHLLAWHGACSQVVRQFHRCQKSLDFNRWPGYAAKNLFRMASLTVNGAGPGCAHTTHSRGLTPDWHCPPVLQHKSGVFATAPGKALVPWVLQKCIKSSFCTKTPRAHQDNFKTIWCNQQHESPTLQSKGTGGAETPPFPHGQRQVGQAEEKRACFGLNSQLPSPCTWGQEAAKIDGFNLELALGIKKLGRQRGKQALSSSGTLFRWCQSPEVSGWLLLWMGGDTEARGAAGSMPKGTAAVPHLPRAGSDPPHCISS